MELNPVLIWDIDGTLLTTNGRGFPCVVRAVEEVLGSSNQLENYSNTHGTTDLDVIKNLSKKHSERLTNQKLREILKLYEKYIETEFIRTPPIVLPNVVETLKLVNKFKFETAIGTGNSIAGARIKLKTSNLLKFFKDSNFYCSSIEYPQRIDVFRNAKERIDGNKIGIVIGDTPSDIQSAFSVGFKCIAVESGVFSYSELEYFKPDALLKRNWVPTELLSSIKKIVSTLEISKEW